MNQKIYQYDAVIQPADKGGAYVPFPYDIRKDIREKIGKKIGDSVKVVIKECE